LDAREIVSLFQFLSLRESELDGPLRSIFAKLEQSLFQAASIEEMETLRSGTSILPEPPKR